MVETQDEIKVFPEGKFNVTGGELVDLATPDGIAVGTERVFVPAFDVIGGNLVLDRFGCLAFVAEVEEPRVVAELPSGDG